MARTIVLTLLSCLSMPAVALAQFGNPPLIADLRDQQKQQADINRINEELLRQSAEGVKKYNERMSSLRARFWSEYPNGKDLGPIAEEFARALWFKDLSFLVAAALPEGTGTFRAAMADTLLSGMDGGIPSSARPRFSGWADAVRRRMGVTANQFVFPNPARVMAAIDATQAEYEQYRLDRDFAEFDAAGREPAWITDTPSYVVSIFLRYARMDMATARREYEAMGRLLGAPHVAAAAGRLRRASKKDGELIDLSSLGLTMVVSDISQSADELRRARQPLPRNTGLVWSHTPLTALRVMVGVASTDPKKYLLGAIDLTGNTGGWESVGRIYERWAAAYGERAVLDAAASVMKAPRFYSGRIQDPAHPSNDFRDAYTAFERILIRAGSPAAYVQVLIASGLGSDSKTAESARYAELAAIRGEAALLDAARQAIALLSQDPASLSRAHSRLLQQLRIGAPKAHEALRELVTGSTAIGPVTTNMVANPTYLTWAVFERGAQVVMEERTYTLTTAPVRGNRPAAAPVEKTVAIVEHRRTLDEARDGAVTIEESRVNQAAKLRRLEDLVRYEARIPDERIADVWFAAEVLGDRAIARETTGQESCDVAGRSLPCRWVRREYPGLRGGEETVTLWFSDLVPGGVVRRVHETTPARGGSRTVSDARATSFSGTRKSNVPSVVANPDPRPASASPPPAVVRGPGRTTEPATAVRERPSASQSPSSSVQEITAVPAGTTLVVRLLEGIDAKSRSGAFIRAALEQPLVVGGEPAAPAGAVFRFRYRIASDRQDRRQLAYFLEAHSLEVGLRRVPVARVEPAPGSQSLEGRGDRFIVLPAGTVLTLVVR